MSKPTFSQMPVAAVEEMAKKAPGGTEVLSATKPEPQPAAPVTSSLRLPVKVATQTMSFKVPKDVYDELRNFTKMTDIPMKDVMVEGAKKELALLKKKFGIE